MFQHFRYQRAARSTVFKHKNTYFVFLTSLRPRTIETTIEANVLRYTRKSRQTYFVLCAQKNVSLLTALKHKPAKWWPDDTRKQQIRKGWEARRPTYAQTGDRSAAWPNQHEFLRLFTAACCTTLLLHCNTVAYDWILILVGEAGLIMTPRYLVENRSEQKPARAWKRANELPNSYCTSYGTCLRVAKALKIGLFVQLPEALYTPALRNVTKRDYMPSPPTATTEVVQQDEF